MKKTIKASAEEWANEKIMSDIELARAEARKRDAEIKKMDAEINKWIQETIRDKLEYEEQKRKSDREHAQKMAEFAALVERQRAESAKMAAERAQIERVTAWHPLTAIGVSVGATAALIGATAAVVRLFIV